MEAANEEHVSRLGLCTFHQQDMHRKRLLPELRTAEAGCSSTELRCIDTMPPVWTSLSSISVNVVNH